MISARGKIQASSCYRPRPPRAPTALDIRRPGRHANGNDPTSRVRPGPRADTDRPVGSGGTGINYVSDDFRVGKVSHVQKAYQQVLTSQTNLPASQLSRVDSFVERLINNSIQFILPRNVPHAGCQNRTGKMLRNGICTPPTTDRLLIIAPRSSRPTTPHRIAAQWLEPISSLECRPSLRPTTRTTSRQACLLPK